MACRTVRTENGTLWICGELDDVPCCRVCGCMATQLCDYPIGNDKTCDSALCSDCSHSIKGDLDYCPEHAGEYGKILIYQKMESEGSGI